MILLQNENICKYSTGGSDQSQMGNGHLPTPRTIGFHDSQSQLPLGFSALSPLSSRDSFMRPPIIRQPRDDVPMAAASDGRFCRDSDDLISATPRKNATRTTAGESSSRASKTRKKVMDERKASR